MTFVVSVQHAVEPSIPKRRAHVGRAPGTGWRFIGFAFLQVFLSQCRRSTSRSRIRYLIENFV
jgi:hypothetical protein